MNYSISNKYLKVTISSIGAELVSILKDSKERLWQNENKTWERHAPILFPYAGEVNVIIDGINYPSKKHGFLRDQQFDLVNIKDDYIELSFKSNEDTKKIYPFNFEFKVIYEIKDFSLIIKYKVINISNKEMYFSIGAHESFLLPDDIKNYYVVFENEEHLVSLYNNPPLDLGKSNIFDLDTPLLDNSDCIILKNIKSREVSIYDKRKNYIIAKSRFDGFSNFLLWHSLNSKMICLEPWINIPDMNEEDKKKEFKDKENIIKLKDKESKEFIRTIYYY